MLDMSSMDGKTLRDVRVRDIMSRFAITILEDEPLLSAAHLITRFKISGIPVVSKTGQLRGIITATDLFRIMGNIVADKSETYTKSDKNIPVKDVMITDVSTIAEDAFIVDAITLMCAKNIRTLPVVANGQITGVIGRRDVLNTFFSLYKTDS